jgi:4-hydroxy-tetrahydrodipicolinate reductase
VSEPARIRVAIGGLTGRMGRAIASRIADSRDLTLAGGTARAAGDVALPDGGRVSAVPVANAAALVAGADVLIDVSSPESLETLLHAAGDALAGRALVVGTTGLPAALEAALDAQATQAAVLVAANFSVGVNLLVVLAERAARTLDAMAFDAEILEIHHGRKVDAPSGTALALGRAVARGRDAVLDVHRRDGRSGTTGVRPTGEIGLHAVRGGGVVGEHRVLFLGQHERIELAHAAHDRGLFADGALVAARWLAGKPPGRYTMTQVLGL